LTDKDSSSGEERIVSTSCSYDCGARCVLKVHVRDGIITRIGTDERPMPGLKACVRGLAQKDVVYAPDRITKPLKRVGAKGQGRFEPISWDDALEAVSRELLQVRSVYGNDSIFLVDYSGSISPLQGFGRASRRFFNLFGGCTTTWGITSYEAALFSALSTFGTVYTGATKDNFLHSKLILLWGFDPVVTRFGPDTVHYLTRAKKSGARIVCVDPRLNHTAKALADEWIAVKPGTDTAMMIAMAFVMITEKRHDQNFINAHTHGFEKFEEYVLGKQDGKPKTPAWAEEITGVGAGAIAHLAREYAAVKPAALIAGWAAGRTAFGEQYHRAASTLAAMTGNIGIPGGFAAGGIGRIPLGYLGKTFPAPGDMHPTVHVSDVFDAMLHGKTGGYPSDIKMLYVLGCNLLTQFLNANKGRLALDKPEFIVVHERFLTPTALYADVILPVTTALEGVDIGQPWSGSPYLTFLNKAIEPLGETKSDLEIFSELAKRLGIEGFNTKSDEEWLRTFVEATPGLPKYEVFKEKGFHELDLPGPWVAFQEHIEKHVPFSTPSGKIEIWSRRISEMNHPLIPPIPKYIEPWEGPQDALISRYPLQLVSPHARTRVNSQFDNIPSLKAKADDTLWMNPLDAGVREINSGDRVMIYNERGRVLSTVKVTERIMTGVVSLDAGAWYQPDHEGIDRGGCVNVLTRDGKSPAGAFPCNSCLVQVEKAVDEIRRRRYPGRKGNNHGSDKGLGRNRAAHGATSTTQVFSRGIQDA
jgi:anaerobic dimethyl sulfoxide reductase subunit A